ncbi:hypothetical protein MHYP_G00322310 [Metynnis hypsauchen]
MSKGLPAVSHQRCSFEPGFHPEPNFSASSSSNRAPATLKPTLAASSWGVSWQELRVMMEWRLGCWDGFYGGWEIGRLVCWSCRRRRRREWEVFETRRGMRKRAVMVS